jgi:hypothetical protein
MKPANQITAMVIDNGLFSEVASRLSRDFAKTYYCQPGAVECEFPLVTRCWIGRDLEGLTVVPSFWPYLDKCDLFVFPDNCHAPLQKHLLALGKVVWGGRDGDELEMDRARTKKLMEKAGLPVQPWRIVEGVDALTKWLSDNPNTYAKISRYRGLTETFGGMKVDLLKPKLDDLRRDLGPDAKDFPFVVEDAIEDAIEIGLDGWCIDGRQPPDCLCGIEIKDKAYAGVVLPAAKWPKPIRMFNAGMEWELRRVGYRGFLSSELRCQSADYGPMIDLCCRCGIPPADLYCEMIGNLGEIVWQGAQGVMVPPKWISRYGAQAMIDSEWSAEHWQPIGFPPSMRKYVKLRYAAKDGKEYFSAPQGPGTKSAGCVVGFGSTLDAACAMCAGVAKKVEGYGISIHTESFEKLHEQFEDAAAHGCPLEP